MTAAVAALVEADYTIPTVIYNDKRNRVQRKANQYLFHGAWSFRREAFERVGGYPFIQSGQDQGLLRRFKSAKLRRADPIQQDPRPSYVYRWFTSHSTHISAMGTDGYERLAGKAAERIGTVTPRWDVDWSKLAAAEMEALLSPFERGKNTDTVTGFGLGLTIVATVARQHGGRIEFEDGPAGVRAKLWLRRM